MLSILIIPMPEHFDGRAKFRARNQSYILAFRYDGNMDDNTIILSGLEQFTFNSIT